MQNIRLSFKTIVEHPKLGLKRKNLRQPQYRGVRVEVAELARYPYRAFLGSYMRDSEFDILQS